MPGLEAAVAGDLAFTVSLSTCSNSLSQHGCATSERPLCQRTGQHCIAYTSGHISAAAECRTSFLPSTAAHHVVWPWQLCVLDWVVARNALHSHMVA